MSSGSSGNNVMDPVPSRSTFCLINLMLEEGLSSGRRLCCQSCDGCFVAPGGVCGGVVGWMSTGSKRFFFWIVVQL